MVVVVVMMMMMVLLLYSIVLKQEIERDYLGALLCSVVWKRGENSLKVWESLVRVCLKLYRQYLIEKMLEKRVRD
jgi:hypothetical protein